MHERIRAEQLFDPITGDQAQGEPDRADSAVAA
jgi:hypothetical protein